MQLPKVLSTLTAMQEDVARPWYHRVVRDDIIPSPSIPGPYCTQYCVYACARR